MFFTESHILELRPINNVWWIVSNNSIWILFLLIHHVTKLNIRLRNRLTIFKKKRLIKTLTRWYAFVWCFDDVHYQNFESIKACSSKTVFLVYEYSVVLLSFCISLSKALFYLIYFIKCFFFWWTHYSIWICDKQSLVQ